MNITDFDSHAALPGLPRGLRLWPLRHKAEPVEGEVIGLLPEAACERDSEWMRQLIGFDAQTKILERRLEAPLAWPGAGVSG